MIAARRRRWLAIPSDPLPQLADDHPTLGSTDHLTACSQSAALVHWPAIESHDGPVSIVLRRVDREDPAEWRDHLTLLGHLLAQSKNRDIALYALTEAAAVDLSAETNTHVAPLPPMARAFHGDRTLTLSRADGPLQITGDHPEALAARQYNLARLRRVAILRTAGVDGDLSDIAQFANGHDNNTPAPVERSPTIIVIVPNGFGIGHVTRMLAVAQKLRAERDARVIFWSFSRAVGLISQFGFNVIARHTARHMGADPQAWRTWETEDFAATLRQSKPDLIVQDSASLEAFAIDALARPGVGAARVALVRRGMWQKHILGTNPLMSEDLADVVVEPGDLAAPADRGITRGRAETATAFAKIRVCAPVTLTTPSQMLDRNAARKALGLKRGRHCLISLGGDAYGDWSHLVRHLADAAKGARIRLVWARSPLAAPNVAMDETQYFITRRVYPLARYLAAFDGVVSAAGYNSFHELMHLYNGPVLFAPRQHSALDDQTARARFANSQGWASHVETGDAEHAAVAAFIAEVRASKANTTRPQWRDGAAEMSRLLVDLIETGSSTT